jgi:hypothetical protein
MPAYVFQFVSKQQCLSFGISVQKTMIELKRGMSFSKVCDNEEDLMWILESEGTLEKSQAF